MANPDFLLYASDGVNPVYMGLVQAATISGAQSIVTAALNNGLGVSDGIAGAVTCGLVQFGATFTITPPNH